MTITTLLNAADLRLKVDAALFDQGFFVAHASSPERFSRLVELGNADGVLLGYSLPGIALFQVVIRTTRERRPATAILVFAPASSSKQRRDLIGIGADDVLTEWNGLQLTLCLRQCVYMRRSRIEIMPSPSSILQLCGVELNLSTRQASRDGKSLELREAEFALLQFMIRNPNRAVSLSTLRDQRWIFSDLNRQSIELIMKSLRRKLDSAFAKTLIQYHGDEIFVFACDAISRV